MYWSLTTMTTVGYGDLSLDTTAGKVIAVVVMLVGVGFAAVLTGAIAEHFIAPAEERIEAEELDLHAKLDAVAARLERIEATLVEKH